MSPEYPLLMSHRIDEKVQGQGHSALKTDNGLSRIIAFR